MGRQHTTWISDETWEQMKRIPGESVSERFRNAVKFADPVEGMRLRSLERQLEVAKEGLYQVNRIIDSISSAEEADHAVIGIKELLEELWWMVEQ